MAMGLYHKGPGEAGPGEQGSVHGGTAWGSLPAAMVQGWLLGWPRASAIIWWQQHPWPRL